jgi:16S rRNA (guanine(966)-N(2))-methyltransferase RsmD
LRPTSDRVREALFNILAARVEGSLFLDAFAGTGVVGIEALSRGAARVVFAERDRRALRLIAENLSLGSWHARSEVLAGDVGHAIDALVMRSSRFGIIFVDPPYETDLPQPLLAGFASLLAPDGVMVIEHRSGRGIDLPPDADLTPLRIYRHGDTSLALTRRRGAGAQT